MHSSSLLHVPEQITGSYILLFLQGQSLSQISGSIIKIWKELLDSRIELDFYSNPYLHFGVYCNPKMLGHTILTADSELLKAVPVLVFEIKLKEIFFELWIYMETHKQVIIS